MSREMLATDDVSDDALSPLVGLDEAQLKLNRALKEFIEKNDEKLFPLTLHLRMAGQGGADPVQSFQFELEESIGSLTHDVLETAKSEAEGIGTGRISFTLLAHKANGRCTFSLLFPKGQDQEEDEMAMNPSHKGMVSQQMRHNEKLINVTVNSWTAINRANERALQDKDDRIRVLERDRVKMMEVYENLIQQQHQRDMDIKREESSEGRKKQVGDLLMMGMPTVINAIAQKRLLPEAQTSIEAMMEGWVSTITPDQFNKMLGSGLLDPGQAAGFHQLMQAFVEREEARKQQQNAEAEQTQADITQGPPATIAEIANSFVSQKPNSPQNAQNGTNGQAVSNPSRKTP